MTIDDARSALAWLASWRSEAGESPPRSALAGSIEAQIWCVEAGPPAMRAGHMAALRILRDAWPSDYGPLPIDPLATIGGHE